MIVCINNNMPDPRYNSDKPWGIIGAGYKAYAFGGDRWCITEETTGKFVKGYENTDKETVIAFIIEKEEQGVE